MPKLTPTVTPDLVERYIKNAELVAGSPTERLAVQRAAGMNRPLPKHKNGKHRKGRFISTMYAGTLLRVRDRPDCGVWRTAAPGFLHDVRQFSQGTVAQKGAAEGWEKQRDENTPLRL
jgi:hypothetical protein